MLSGGIGTPLADNVVEETAIPAHKASFHVPVFQNDFVRLLNVNIPPGRSTGYHLHVPDLVTGHRRGLRLGRAGTLPTPNPPAHQPKGNVVYTKYGQPG
jgi:hypothetical protein